MKMLERLLTEVDKKPLGKEPDNTHKAPENIQKSTVPINEEEINAKRKRAAAPEVNPILRAEGAAEGRPSLSSSGKGEAEEANGEVHHCAVAEVGDAQPMRCRGVSEVTVLHTSGPEREQMPSSSNVSTAKAVNEKRILKEKVRSLMLDLYATGCDAAVCDQVQWGDKLREFAAKVLAEMDADDNNQEYIIDLEPQPTVQPAETQPSSFPTEPTYFYIEDKVLLQGLVTRPDLNGRAGIVLEKPEEDGSFPVKVIPVRDGGYEVKSSELIRAKPENLRRPIPFEIAYFQYFY